MISVYNNNEPEHQEHVRKILEQLFQAKLQVSIEKCEFHTRQTKYPGYIVTAEGIGVYPEKAITYYDLEAASKCL
jgi:hypothetical protein